MKRLIAIGDIHRHLDKLNRSLVQVAVTAEDQLVFLDGAASGYALTACDVLSKQVWQTEFPFGVENDQSS
jgi:hypothetical protein